MAVNLSHETEKAKKEKPIPNQILVGKHRKSLNMGWNLSFWRMAYFLGGKLLVLGSVRFGKFEVSRLVDISSLVTPTDNWG